MPILDNIKNAEAEAEKIREDARSEAERIIEEARTSADKKAVAILEEAKATLAKNNTDYLEKIKQLEIDIKNKVKSDLETLEKKANSNLESAINFIVEKVFTL